MSTHTLTIPKWHPSRSNQREGHHWTTRKKLKDADKQFVSMYAYQQQIPKAATRRKVSLMLVMKKGQRRCDPDAYWKTLLDALVHAGLLCDDGPNWCVLGDVNYERAQEHATIITLEDLPEEK